mgnify:CR=1 FL=1
MKQVFEKIVYVQIYYNQEKYQKGIYFPIICNDVIAKKRLERVLPISQNYVSKYQLEGKKVLLFVITHLHILSSV